MVKQKLINKRKSQQISQENMAFYLGINQSQYSRREKGISKISKTEWYKLAEILKTPLNEIYDSEDYIYNIAESDSFLKEKKETLAKYIQKLEFENINLKEKVVQLQSVVLLSKTI